MKIFTLKQQSIRERFLQKNKFNHKMTSSEISKIIVDKLMAEVDRQLGITEPEINMTHKQTLSGNQFQSKYEWFLNELQELDNEILNNSQEVILESYDCISMLILFKDDFTEEQYTYCINELKQRIKAVAIQSQLRFANGETTNAEYKFTVNGYRLDSKTWFNNWEQLKLSKGYTKNPLRSYDNFIDFLTNIFTK